MKMKALTIAIAVASAATSLSSFAGTPNFSGYGRYALEASGDEIVQLKGEHGEINGVGRLGNEDNWMEFMLSQGFENGDAKFDMNVMLNTPGYSPTWGDTIGLAQFYGGGKGIFASQPDAYVWAGKRFYGREQGGLSDYFMLSADGSGAGVDNLNLGFAQLDLGWTQGGGGTTASNKKGSVNSLAFNLHDIKVSEQGALKFRGNYAFTTGDLDDAANPDRIENNDAWQVFASYRQGLSNGWFQVAARYETDAAALISANSAGQNWSNYEDKKAASYGAFLDGAVNFGEMTAMEYNANYLLVDCKETGCSFDEKVEYAVSVRPQHHWTEYMATALEAGVHFTERTDVGGSKNKSDAWKITLSQNFQVGHFMWSRPVVRFYAVTGEVDTEGKDKVDVTKIGAMVEAWW
ncbi:MULTISPECIES: carbohydrate porin [unclassified Agarivorans]|uniref:carbohydrate porin n=1 Tax=unclassified Agarivorans TaxID=2636026 RepID=UPI0026E2E4D0|nr:MULTISPECIES: carbohydrate porin [unclassified Agarivorans]MDO6685445.1 carbohydrate porin [Agarivorans sp. 3_MG-2023]MDO6715831.1 carbohydrate porin [Agarivorans sp. 2_MG-2023]